MITHAQHLEARDRAWQHARRAGLVLADHEINSLEVADFGLSRLHEVGAQILTLEANDWVSIKILILFPWQLEPQHRHPPSVDGTYPGKTEVLRVQHGTLLHYYEGSATPSPLAKPSPQDYQWLDVWHETVLKPADQLVLPPNTWHWFQAAEEGAVVWTISSKVTDSADQWMDPRIVRKTVIGDQATEAILT
jgi:D-lyxose ketol-isomerase